MKAALIPLLAALLAAPARADDDIPLLRPEERRAVDAQTDEFNQALTPALAHAAESTVRVWSGKRRLAYGTVVGDGSKVLTKWSELVGASRQLRVEAAGGQVRSVTVSGIYADDDLVLLDVRGTALTPVRWSATVPKLGAFLAAAQPDGKPAAFGVVSVLERNLRDTDQAFLGITSSMDFDGPGVQIRQVSENSGAHTAGLQPGDVILKVNQRPISGILELKNALTGTNPGEEVTLTIENERGENPVNVMLGNRPQLPNYLGDRLRTMERMGSRLSRVRDSFTRVIQTDMRPQPEQIGGPVVNLKGEVIGITMARATRTRSLVMPAAAVETLLKTAPQDPSLAMFRDAREQAPAVPVRGRAVAPGGLPRANQQRLRRHLSDMQQLMDFMREEMEMLEQGR